MSVNSNRNQDYRMKDPTGTKLSENNKQVGSITGILIDTEERNGANGGQKKKRIASPDLWEITRLKGGNVLNMIDDENLQGGQALDEDNELDEDEPEIELNDEEPPFLFG